MIMAPTMPLNVYCMAILTCIMRDHRMQLLKYIIQFNIISLTHTRYKIQETIFSVGYSTTNNISSLAVCYIYIL